MPRGHKNDPPINEFGQEVYNDPSISKQYVATVQSDPKYSLEISKGFSEEEYEFIRLYYDLRNVNTVAEVLGMEIEVANALFVKPSIMQEIKRLDLAVYHHQFAKNLLTIDEIGGYLSSLLIDDMVPFSQKLDAPMKLKVAEMLIKLNTLKLEAFSKPEDYSYQDVESQIKDMSVNAIKRLLEANPDKTPIDVTPQPTNVDLGNLKDKTPSELLSLVEETSKNIDQTQTTQTQTKRRRRKKSNE